MVEDDQSAAHPAGRSSRGISSKENGCSAARHSQNSEESCCSALAGWIEPGPGCANATEAITRMAPNERRMLILREHFITITGESTNCARRNGRRNIQYKEDKGAAPSE